MTIRLIGIACLHRLVAVIAIGLLLVFVIPQNTPMLLTPLAVWAFSVALSIAFAGWAFARRTPIRSDFVIYLGTEVLLYLCGLLLYGVFISDWGPVAAFSPEFLIQLVFEIGGICGTAIFLRRRALHQKFTVV